MSKVIFLYNQGSQGGISLAKEMGIKRLRHQGSKWVGGAGNTLYNWGSSELPNDLMNNGTRIINNPTNVRNMTNKRDAFTVFSGVCRTPEWTMDINTAQVWLRAGKTVFARTSLNGHSGAGIQIMSPDHPDTWNVRANLYTMYVPKTDEYRIHIVNDQVIISQRKGLRNEFRGQPDVNWKIRNLANGFVFVRENVNPPQDVIDQAKLAMRASGLVFGAVDVIWNARRNEAFILEVNTAPGLEGSSVNDYATALSAL